MAEHSAVNRRVVGSSPTCGATTLKAAGSNSAAFFLCQLVFVIGSRSNGWGNVTAGIIIDVMLSRIKIYTYEVDTTSIASLRSLSQDVQRFTLKPKRNRIRATCRALQAKRLRRTEPYFLPSVIPVARFGFDRGYANG